MKNVFGIIMFLTLTGVVSSCSLENTLDEGVVEELPEELYKLQPRLFFGWNITEENINCIRNERALNSPTGYEKYLILFEATPPADCESWVKTRYIPCVVYYNTRSKGMCIETYDLGSINNLGFSTSEVLENEIYAQEWLDEEIL